MGELQAGGLHGVRRLAAFGNVPAHTLQQRFILQQHPLEQKNVPVAGGSLRLQPV